MEQSKASANIGVIGMGVMGTNLAANIESRGTDVALWNITYEETEAFVKQESGTRFHPAKTAEEFVASIQQPRAIILMITAGKPIDLTIERFLPLLEEGDIIIDGGNSWYEDTQRREKFLQEKGVHFVGMGVSGGSEGARLGPSLMPGGTEYAYKQIAPILESIAAQTDSGPCVTHVGADGAGHFVKMVHNGIEYADMQLIAESYDLLKRLGSKDAAALETLFSQWNKGPLESFLIELTAKVFGVKDDKTGNSLVEMILDKAGQKGTGQWTNQAALSLGVSIPSIAAAVDARTLSSMKDARVAAAPVFAEAQPVRTAIPENLDELVHQALLSSKIIAYAQGLFLIAAAAKEFGWKVNMKETARIWKGGCIIRAALLDEIMGAFERTPDLSNLLLDSNFAGVLKQNINGLRQVISLGAMNGIPLPAFAASLSYFDAFTTARLPQNLVQAQRDAFGSHTYQRTDSPEQGFVHTDWLK
ncbi:MAG: NADP-dependent phosphogluconate dehydrogenase [Deltaproteobacteria bacterium]|nr:NADP-dependent phosphogluconate dehydrogenase [Deltaproteobacteria bacterium]MBN2670751.1 NADP-dependent phosphogluconate dehydrogenase [Deltaproteobacteria bacterium]